MDSPTVSNAISYPRFRILARTLSGGDFKSSDLPQERSMAHARIGFLVPVARALSSTFELDGVFDLYPMLYQGHGAPPWGYQVPFLTFAQDFPGIALGYNLPSFRLAIKVVP